MLLEGEFRSRSSVALRPKGASIWLPQFAKPLKWQAKCDASGVAFSLVSFFWLSKRKKLACLAYDFASALALSKSEYPCGAKATSCHRYFHMEFHHCLYLNVINHNRSNNALLHRKNPFLYKDSYYHKLHY